MKPVAEVAALLAAARLPVPDDEVDGFAASYPALRAAADTLYSVVPEEPC